MDGVIPFPLNLNVVDRGLAADADLGDRIALEPAQPKARITLDQSQRAAGLGKHEGAGEDRGRIASAVEVNEMDRLVKDDALADAQCHPARHQRCIEGNDAVVLAGIYRAKRLLEPGGRLLERLGERDDLDAGRLEPGEVRKIGPELAFDHEETKRRKGGQCPPERAFDVAGVEREARGADQRVHVAEKRAEVGIFPRLDAAMRQAELGVVFDRVLTQGGNEGLARAGKPGTRRLEHVEIALLALGAELLDRQLHGVPLSRLAAELGVARRFELERKLRAAGACHAPV
jgi:hypothetical protein